MRQLPSQLERGSEASEARSTAGPRIALAGLVSKLSQHLFKQVKLISHTPTQVQPRNRRRMRLAREAPPLEHPSQQGQAYLDSLLRAIPRMRSASLPQVRTMPLVQQQ